MEAMAIIGFVFGLAGLSFATKAKNDVAQLKMEFEDFKRSVEASSPPNQGDSSD